MSYIFFQHGSVVMLYHPCTHPVLVQRMRTVLKSCLFRHIITPYNLVPEDRVRMIHICAESDWTEELERYTACPVRKYPLAVGRTHHLNKNRSYSVLPIN